MATKSVNLFHSFDLSEDEELQGSLLTVTQKQFIHNLRTAAAEAKLYLVLDPANIQDYIQQSSYKAGYIEALSDLLQASEASELAINEADNYRS